MSDRESRRGEATGAFALYVLLALWWLWPLPSAAENHLLYVAEVGLNHADLDLGVWSAAWATHALLTDPWNLFDANSFYPAPYSLAYSEHYLGQVPAFAPTYLLTGNPVLATNVLIVLMHGLSGLGVFLLARRFVSVPAALLGGMLYTFYPTRLEHLGHYYMLATGYLPLAIYFTERWLDEARTRDAVGVAVTFGLQLLCSFYLAYAAAFAYGLYLVLVVACRRALLDRRRVVGLGVALSFASAPFLLSSLPYLALRKWGLIPDYGGPGAAVPGLAASITRHHVNAHLFGRGVGIAGGAVALVALVPPWRGGTWPRIVAASIAGLGLLLGFGPEISVGSNQFSSPYAMLQEWLPGFSAVRSSRRFLVVAQLGMALLVALGLERLIGARPARVRWATAAAVALCSYLTFPPLPEVRLHERAVGPSVPLAYRWLADHGEGRPLLELPSAGFDVSARRMYFSETHWLPLLQGYSAYAPAASRYLQKLAYPLPLPSAVEQLTDVVDVGWILVHLDEFDGRGRAWREPLPPGLTKVAQFGEDLVVRVTRQVVTDPRARLFDPQETLGGVPLEAVGPECPGTITLRSGVAPVQPLGGKLRLNVVVRNDGARPWPGLAFRPWHALHLVACFSTHGESCSPLGVPIYQDVPAGGEATVSTLVAVPSYPGPFELQVRLVQPDDGGLDECGVAPLVRSVHVVVPLAGGPPGTFGDTCGPCDWDGVTLSCRCLDRRGAWRDTELSGCAGEYHNQDGELACDPI